jgi:hypothetical protein
LILAACVIWGTYWFRWQPILIHHDNPNRVSNQIVRFAAQYRVPLVIPAVGALYNTPVPLGDYIGIVKNNLLRARMTRTDFFLGKYYSPTSWYFFPVVWIVKTPLPLIILLSISFYQLVKKRQAKENSFRYLFFILSCLLMVLSMMSGLSSLMRYALPLSPFLVIAACGSLSFFSRYRKIVLSLLLLWYIAGTVSMFPHFISYANELSSGHKYQWFTDSNIDWGQGLLSFSNYVAKAQPAQIQFSYFGRDNADRYGFVSDKPWGSHKNNEICEFHTLIFPQYTGPAITAISVTNWHGCGYEKMSEYQMHKVKKVVGESILIF